MIPRKKNPESEFYRLMASHEKRLCLWTLQASKWNRKAAARSLGISYRSLLYKIAKHGLSPAPEALSPKP